MRSGEGCHNTILGCDIRNYCLSLRLCTFEIEAEFKGQCHDYVLNFDIVSFENQGLI